MGPISSWNRDFPANTPPDSYKHLFTTLPLWSNNYNFAPTYTTVHLFTILLLPWTRAFFYIDLPLDMGMLHLDLETHIIFEWGITRVLLRCYILHLTNHHLGILLLMMMIRMTSLMLTTRTTHDPCNFFHII